MAQFSVQGTASASDSAYEFGAGGTITLGGGATADDSIVIVRDITVERTTDFTPAASFDVTALNTQLDTLMAMMAERNEENTRSLRLPLAETTTVFDMQLPVKATRANKVLEFDSNGDPACLVTSTNIATLGNLTSELSTLAAISTDISTVAGIQANVTTVAGIAANVTSVAAKASFITADFVADLNTLATTDIVADLNTLATSDIVTDLNLLATTDNVNNMAALAASGVITNIGTVAGIAANVTTVAGISANVTTVAGIQANVTTVAGIQANVTTVAGIDSEVTTVAGISSNVSTVAGAVSNINTVAGSISNVNTVASSIADVNTFAVRYRIGSSDPSSSLDEGDLFYNSTDNVLKFYNGSAWVNIEAISASAIQSAGALMDSECASLADVKALNQSLTTSASPTFATLNITTIDFGDWTITESSGVLYFATGGTNKMKLDASGNLTVVGNITAYGTM